MKVEWVEAAADAIGEAWDTDEDDDERMRVYARAALAAVAPLIRRATLEEAAEVADNFDKNRSVYDCNGDIYPSTAGKRLAAAIRALD